MANYGVIKVSVKDTHTHTHTHVQISRSGLTTDQSRPHGIETTGLTNTQTGVELQPRIPSRLHKIEKDEPL